VLTPYVKDHARRGGAVALDVPDQRRPENFVDYGKSSSRAASRRTSRVRRERFLGASAEEEQLRAAVSPAVGSKMPRRWMIKHLDGLREMLLESGLVTPVHACQSREMM